MSILNIKQAIKANLDNLVTDGVLQGATTTDIRHNPLDADIPSYPHAFLMPPSVESEVTDNRTVVRTYAFAVSVLFNAENIASPEEVEEAIEAILNEFDNDPTLGGTALGGVTPVSSAPQPFQHNGKDLIEAVIQIQAKAFVSLTFA